MSQLFLHVYIYKCRKWELPVARQESTGDFVEICSLFCTCSKKGRVLHVSTISCGTFAAVNNIFLLLATGFGLGTGEP